MKDRRQSTEFDCRFDGRRKEDKFWSFMVFFLLTIFIGLVLMGCGHKQIPIREFATPPQCNLPEYQWDTRCHAYVPEPDVETDDFEVIE